PVTKQWIVTNGSDGNKVNDIGPAALNNKTQLNNLNKVFPDGNFFNIQSIANAWRNNPKFDQLITFLFHDHACPGVQPGFFITDYIFNNIPLSEGQSYNYIANSIYCKDDSVIYLLGVSPGMGTYMNQRLPSDEVTSDIMSGGTDEAILVVWDSNTNTGTVYIITFSWADIDVSDLTTSDAKREAQIHAYIDLYNGIPNSRVRNPPQTTATYTGTVTESQFRTLQQGGEEGENALQTARRWFASGSNPSGTGSSSPGTGLISSSNGSGTGLLGSSNGANVSGVNVSAATVTNSTSGSVGTQPGDAKAYEVTQAGAQGSEGTPWGLYAIVGVIAVLALGGVGFFYKGGKFGR
ncbi:MAG: FmdE family protein, partial [Methanobacterium formicicum]